MKNKQTTLHKQQGPAQLSLTGVRERKTKRPPRTGGSPPTSALFPPLSQRSRSGLGHFKRRHAARRLCAHAQGAGRSATRWRCGGRAGALQEGLKVRGGCVAAGARDRCELSPTVAPARRAGSGWVGGSEPPPSAGAAACPPSGLLPSRSAPPARAGGGTRLRLGRDFVVYLKKRPGKRAL